MWELVKRKGVYNNAGVPLGIFLLLFTISIMINKVKLGISSAMKYCFWARKAGARDGGGGEYPWQTDMRSYQILSQKRDSV